MLVVETIGRIRREHFVKGKTIKEIVRDLKISRNTVRKVLRSGETSFDYEREIQPRPKLGRWPEDLDRLLTTNAEKPTRERLTLIRIYETLRDLGYEGVSPHILRHTSITWAIQQGVKIWDASEYFGVGEKVIRSVYGHHHPDHQKGVTDAFDRRRTA